MEYTNHSLPPSIKDLLLWERTELKSKFNVGAKMTKFECTGGPAGSQILAWKKSTSEGGEARWCYASWFHNVLNQLQDKAGIWWIYWRCFQTMASSFNSSVAASSVLREQRRSLTFTTLAGQNCPLLVVTFHSGGKRWHESLRASLPDWFEPWDLSAPIFQKILNFRQSYLLYLNAAKLLS